MASVVKVGGSLAKDPKVLMRLCEFLSRLVEEQDFIVVPGGGKLADAVRELDGEYALSEEISHRMALLAVDQYGMLLSDLTPNSEIVHTIEDARKLSSSGGVPILLPARLMFREDPLEHSWDVTSDSVAAWIAEVSKAERLVLVTDVDGIYLKTSKPSRRKKPIPRLSAKELVDLNVETCVDEALPKILLRTGIKCHVVNGSYPDRVARILEGKNTTQTEIFDERNPPKNQKG